MASKPTCDICGKEGQIVEQTFGESLHVDPIKLCRTCRGKLILGVPPNPTREQIVHKINQLSELAEQNKHTRRW